MKTLMTTLVLALLMSSLLMAQTDSTLTDTSSVDITETEPIIADTAAVAAEAQPVAESTDTLAALDSTALDTLAVADTLNASEPEMIWVPRAPEPVKVAGLMTKGPLYYWSNDGLAGLGLDSLSYISLEDPTLIAIKAADCMDIVCHLLATDSSGINYVVVVPEDSSNYQIYNTDSKIVVLETSATDLASAFDTYMQDLTGMEYIAVVPDSSAFIGPPVTAELPEPLAVGNPRMRYQKVKNRQFRSMPALFGNPANLGRNFSSFTAWNLVPNFNLNIHNSLLTPGWYATWMTRGGIWDEAVKNEYLSTIMDQKLALSITPAFQSLFGFRIGHLGVNLSGNTYIKVVIPGNTLGLPMQDILLDRPINNGGFEIEIIPFVAKSTLSYAQPITTGFGNFTLGMNINSFAAAGLLKSVSKDFTIAMTTDSIFVTASGESWVTKAGVTGHLDSLNMDNLDAASTLSTPTIGVDLGLIVDLQPLIKQEVEIQASLSNLGAKYEWTGVTHEVWTFEQTMPAFGNADFDSLEQYQTNESTVISENETYTIDLPIVMKIAGFYQPLSQVLVGIGMEKAFTDEARLGYSSELSINYQLNLYPFPWFDLSYYKQARYGEPVHTFGTGFHFGFLDTGLTMSFFNGLNTDAKGIGFGLRSSLHF